MQGDFLQNKSRPPAFLITFLFRKAIARIVNPVFSRLFHLSRTKPYLEFGMLSFPKEEERRQQEAGQAWNRCVETACLRVGGHASGVISYHKATPLSTPSSHTRKHLVLGGCGMHMVADTAETQLSSTGQVRVLGGAGPDLEPCKPQGQPSASFNACHMQTG